MRSSRKGSADRELLQYQLAIAWGFATECVLPSIGPEDLTWTPGTNVCTVTRQNCRWTAAIPDETAMPIPQPTVPWLLWHVEWWWSDAIARICGDVPISMVDFEWSGSPSGVIAIKEKWDQAVASADLEARVDWLLPEPVPVWQIAGWVPIELMKNVAEINQLILRRANLDS